MRSETLREQRAEKAKGNEYPQARMPVPSCRGGEEVGSGLSYHGPSHITGRKGEAMPKAQNWRRRFERYGVTLTVTRNAVTP